MTGNTSGFVRITHLSSGDLDEMSLPVYEETITSANKVCLSKIYYKEFHCQGHWRPYKNWREYVINPPLRWRGEYKYFAICDGVSIDISIEEYMRLASILLPPTGGN